MWPSPGRYEISIFPTLKGSFRGQKSGYKPHLGLLFHDFSNHFNLLSWSDQGPFLSNFPSKANFIKSPFMIFILIYPMVEIIKINVVK